jgi:hypothetical protein
MKDDFARKVYDYIVDGYLNAVSIGGMVEEWGEDGMTISKMKMKEYSVVSVPANQEALVASKSLDGNQKAELRALANGYARKLLDTQSGENEITKNIEVLETMVATLKEVALGKTEKDKAIEMTNTRVVLRQAQVVDKQIEVVIRKIKLKGENK